MTVHPLSFKKNIYFHSSCSSSQRALSSRASSVYLCILVRSLAPVGSPALLVTRAHVRIRTLAAEHHKRGRGDEKRFGLGRATGFDFGCLVTFCFDRRGSEGWSRWRRDTEQRGSSGRRIREESKTRRKKRGVLPTSGVDDALLPQAPPS